MADERAEGIVRTGRLDDLERLHRLRRRVRTERTAPARSALTILGAAVLGGALVYARFPAVEARVVPGSGGGYQVPKDNVIANLGGSPPHVGAGIYWLVVVPLVWVACGGLFRRRHERGLGRPWWQISLTGLVPFVALVLAQLVLAPRSQTVHDLLDDPDRKVLPVAAVGLGLVLVGFLERVPSLVVAGAVAGLVPLIPLGPGLVVDLLRSHGILGGPARFVAELGLALLLLAALAHALRRLWPRAVR